MLRAVSLYLGPGGLPHVSHCLSRYFSTNLWDSTKHNESAAVCRGKFSLQGGAVNSGWVTRGMPLSANALGNSRVFCATRGGALSSAALAEILPYVRGSGFVLLG